MSKTNDNADQLAELVDALAVKDAEVQTVYRLLNRYKAQITELEIDVTRKEMTIEALNNQIADLSPAPAAAAE